MPTKTRRPIDSKQDSVTKRRKRSRRGVLGNMIGWWSRPAASRPTAGLLSNQAFQVELHRERLRSDRSRIDFSLLILECDGRPFNATERGTVAELLLARVRETDTTGWLSRRRVGIILPYTPAAGAWELADELTARFDAHNVPVRCEVYVHAASSSDSSDPPPSDSSAPKSAADTSQRAIVVDGLDRPVQSMGMLFVEKISFWKRLADIACASLMLLFGMIVMIPAGLAVKLTSPGPMFYRQRRTGFGGREFWIYKFRTMVVNADALKDQLRAQSEQDGPAFKLKNDPRVTPIGRFLRRSCIDELPQLFNVLQGDMSLVGPRPMCSKEARQYEPWQRRRLDVTPGLTCIWQVYGGTKVTFVEWMRMDLRYVRSHSLWGDFGLMLQTVPSVIHRDGVY